MQPTQEVLWAGRHQQEQVAEPLKRSTGVWKNEHICMAPLPPRRALLSRWQISLCLHLSLPAPCLSAPTLIH